MKASTCQTTAKASPQLQNDDGHRGTPRDLDAQSWLMTKKLFTLLDLCVSSLRRGHANLLCIVPILTDDPRRESSFVLQNWIPRGKCTSTHGGCSTHTVTAPWDPHCAPKHPGEYFALEALAMGYFIEASN